MSKVFVHLSDLHYVAGSAETYGVVLKALFEDLKIRLKNQKATPYLILSGDVVKQGSQKADYEDFLKTVAARFSTDLGIGKEATICVPGNHDVSRSSLADQVIDHEGVISQCTNEYVFNNFIRSKKPVLRAKFDNYVDFENKFARFGVGEEALGAGHRLCEEVGVFCLNTAYFSAGGMDGVQGRIEDKGRLVADTRGLHAWIQQERCKTKILVMHHPLNWLSEWSAQEIKALLGKDISLLITGHTHDQDVYTRSNGVGEHAHCLAPALFTKKTDDLGYALIYLGEDSTLDRVEYRQWVTKSQKFVCGSALSSTDDGVVMLRRTSASTECSKAEGALTSSRIDESRSDHVGDLLKSRLDGAVQYFDGQPSIFVEPIIAEHSETSSANSDKPKDTYGVLGVLERGFPAGINAPPQFGLTCLARHYCLRVWQAQSKLWICIDALTTKPHRKAIVDAIESELLAFGVKMADVHGVVIDSVRSSDKDGAKLVHKVAELYPGLDLLFMRSNDHPGVDDLGEVGKKPVKESFLWSMSRSSIRSIVSQYNDMRPLGDEDLITSRLTQDLLTMNIHRTPLNCFTLLKASEVQYEDSPVNRAELIKRVLFLLFSGDGVPTYKSRPDVKDCEFVLGYFCEGIIRSGEVRFRREEFRSSILKFCSSNLIDIDVEWVFDVLFRNNIIVARGLGYEFKFVYWVMYFAAQRMCQSDDFRDYIFELQRYSTFPEIIEFYTGTNRSMSDAVTVLCGDLREAMIEFDHKIAWPAGFDIFSSAQWQPSAPGLEQMKADTSLGVERSNLPESVKDQYADRSYDRARPYAQEVGAFLHGYSYNKMLQAMKAAAKALRNSDYVDVALKRKLLSEIIAVWERVATVILVLIPALAKSGEAVFEDVRYVLTSDFPEDLDERFQAVLQMIPLNIATYYQDDLFSQKMAPLISREIETSSSNMARHLLAHVLIKNRPRNWHIQIKSYVSTLSKNSFYLLDVYKALRNQYRFGYVDESGLEAIEFLIKMCAAKHVTGAKELGVDKVNKIASKMTVDGGEVVPERRVNERGDLIEAASTVAE
jgi:predicted phosphodiesterase